MVLYKSISLAVSGCLLLASAVSAQQRSPQAYKTLAFANLRGGPTHLKEAVRTAEAAIECGAGGPCSEGQDVLLRAAFLAGDYNTAARALAEYTRENVRESYAEKDPLLDSFVSKRGKNELAAILKANPVCRGAGDTRGLARQLLLDALVALLEQRYSSVITTSKRFDGGFRRFNFAPESDFALELSAAANLMISRADRASVFVRQLLSRQPVNASTLIFVDIVSAALEQRETGIKLILQREPTNEKVCKLARARILDEMARPQEALSVLNLLAKGSPNDYEAILRQGKLEVELNQEVTALAHFNKYLKKYPHAGEARLLRAQVYSKRKEWMSALADLNEALKSDYGVVRALRLRAACHAALGHSIEARSDSVQAERLVKERTVY